VYWRAVIMSADVFVVLGLSWLCILQVPVFRPMDLMVEASPRRIFANAHTYHINSISINSDYETYLSADDLRINLWHLEITDRSFSIFFALFYMMGTAWLQQNCWILFTFMKRFLYSVFLFISWLFLPGSCKDFYFWRGSLAWAIEEELVICMVKSSVF